MFTFMGLTMNPISNSLFSSAFLNTFLRIFKEAFISALSNFLSFVWYNPLFILFPENWWYCLLSLLYFGILSLSIKLAFDVYDSSVIIKLIPSFSHLYSNFWIKLVNGIWVNVWLLTFPRFEFLWKSLLYPKTIVLIWFSLEHNYKNKRNSFN